MPLITENELKAKLKNLDVKEYKIPKNYILTPSARTYLNDRNIRLVVEDKKMEETTNEVRNYVSFDGGIMSEKPEYMTQLYGDMLVFKDHRIIKFRGKIDILSSEILNTSVKMRNSGFTKLSEDLDSILSFERKLIRCEVLNEPVGDIKLLGIENKMIREMSHNTKKYFGMDFFTPTSDMGIVISELDLLRSKTREVEISAYEAFKDEFGKVTRQDIIESLNRISSIFWIMMFKFKKGDYTKNG